MNIDQLTITDEQLTIIISNYQGGVMKENVLLQKSYEFALSIIKMYQTLIIVN